MAIIQKLQEEFETLKGIKVRKKILDEVNRYCDHFKVSLSEFVNQGFEHILRKDTDWKKANKNTKDQSKKGQA